MEGPQLVDRWLRAHQCNVVGKTDTGLGHVASMHGSTQRLARRALSLDSFIGKCILFVTKALRFRHQVEVLYCCTDRIFLLFLCDPDLREVTNMSTSVC